MSRLLECNITNNPRAFIAPNSVDTNVDDDCAWLDPVTLHQLWATYGDNEDVCSSAELGYILRFRMRHSDSAVLGHQKLRHRLTDNVGFTNNHGVEPFEATESFFEHHQAAKRSARNQRILTGRQTASVQNMKAV